jgi:hypothetical protein
MKERLKPLVETGFGIGGLLAITGALTALYLLVPTILLVAVPTSNLLNIFPVFSWYVPLYLVGAGVVTITAAGAASSILKLDEEVSSKSVTSKTADETAAASERSIATSAETLTRDFQTRVQKEIDSAVTALASTSEQVIKSQLADHIEATVGSNLVAVLGAQLAKQTSAEYKLNDFRQLALDSFVQMRSRAIQYADAAQRQSLYFRVLAIILSIIGLSTLGFLLIENYQQFFKDPELIKSRAEWTMIIMRNGPGYTFVLLCEFLSLLMFRYQSKSLEYMRYFSNEGTNLDARRIAFMSAIHYQDEDAMKKLIEKLESTERNFLIDKNQRTLELANNESEDRVIEKLFAKVMRTSRSSHDEEEGEERPKRTPPRKKAAHTNAAGKPSQ